MKKNKNAEKRCINCGRIIVDETNKTGLCPKCTKEGVAIGGMWYNDFGQLIK